MKRSDEVESLVNHLYALMRAGDADALAGMIADDDGVLVIGTDPGEWWDSTTAARAAMHEQHEAMGGGLDIKSGELHGYADGDVGWFDDQPTALLLDGTELPIRVTGVTKRSNGELVMQQGRWSPTANLNDVVFGTPTTTT